MAQLLCETLPTHVQMFALSGVLKLWVLLVAGGTCAHYRAGLGRAVEWRKSWKGVCWGPGPGYLIVSFIRGLYT